MTEKGTRRRAFLDRAQVITQEHFEKTANGYDNQFPKISPMHAECLEDFLSRLGPSAAVLDAACGTGLYFSALAGRVGRLLGIDQSVAMLLRAKEKHPDVETWMVSLQALRRRPDMTAGFDGVICIDALEWILREDWPAVLDGFNRVLRAKGHAYITVEIPGEEERRKLARPLCEGAAEGEIRVKDWYNHFPRVEDVRCWLDNSGFEVELEKHSEFYRHLILRKRD